MRSARNALFFDVDGVLLDSLPAHLQICHDKAVAYGIEVKIPSILEFRRLVRNGVKISPMFYFFKAVGFTTELAKRAVIEYEIEFSTMYRSPVFRNAHDVIEELYLDRWTIGIVTSNISSNVVPALGSIINYFDSRCIFTFDRYENQPSKAWCLKEGAKLLDIKPFDCIYIGDLPSDAEAAKTAGCKFVGAAYGWGIDSCDPNFKTIDELRLLPAALCSL